MKILIAEDDLTSRLLLQEFLGSYGPIHNAVNGREAVEAVRIALETCEKYDLICLDIMMPEMDGQEALRQIRLLEQARGLGSQGRAQVIMTTALGDRENVEAAAEGQCNGFLIKPIAKRRLLEKLLGLGLRKAWTLGPDH